MKIDDNHGAIVSALKAEGLSVQSLAGIGGGVPDLLVGARGLTYLVEVKDGEKTAVASDADTRSKALDWEVDRLASGPAYGRGQGEKLGATYRGCP